MAKRVHAAAVHAPAALLALLLSPNVLADTKFTPTLGLKETYTDNVALANEDKARAQFISEFTPGFTVENQGPRLKLNAAYQLHYYMFADKDIAGTQRSQSQFQGDMKSMLVDDLLYLDGAASVGQQAVSAFGPQLASSGYSTANRANVKTWRVTPYLRQRLGAFASSELRYTHDSVDAGNSGLGATDSDNLSLNLASGPSFRKFSWNAFVSHRTVDDKLAPETTVDNASLGLRYALTNEWSLTSSAGYDSYDYQSLGGKTKGSSYNAGFVWTPSSRTSITANAGKRYYGSSYLLNAIHRSRHTVWTIHYDDAVTTTRAQFLLPSTVDTAALLDNLFKPNYPDPVQRAAAVAAYIALTGLPPALADNINYFSNRYILQKQFQASVAFSSARTTTLLSLADTRRNALSAIQTDSPLQGSNSANLNDNVHQQSVSLNWSWRAGARSTLSASALAARNVSTSTSVNTDNRSLRVSLNRQFHSKMNGALEVRRTSGSRLGSSNYRENAISASLSMKL